MNTNETSTPPSPTVEAKPKAKSKWKAPLGIGLFLCVSVFAYCAPPGKFGKPSMDITGIVYDQDTMQPLEGAYVLAVYEESAVGMAGSGNWCVKTKGMYTGKDGSYHFPVEKLDNRSPANVFAIKPDYYLFDRVIPEPDEQRWQTKGTYSNRHVYLKKQDKAKPSFRHGFGGCQRPESMQAIEAAVTFLEIEGNESQKYGGNAAWYKESIELTRKMAAAEEAARNKKRLINSK